MHPASGSGEEQYETDIERRIRPELRQMVDACDSVAPPPPADGRLLLALDTLASPYGCSVQVQDVLASFDDYHLPPDLRHIALRTRLEAYTAIKRERLYAASGIGELLDLILRLFIGTGDAVVTCPPDARLYRTRAALAGAEVVQVSRTPDFRLAGEAVCAAITDRTRLIIIGAPNMLTGSPVRAAEIVPLLQSGAVVVVDESLYAFADPQNTVAPLVAEFDNLIVLRSMDHWAGLTGLGAAYGLFPTPLMPYLWRVAAGKGPNIATQLAMIAALDDSRHREAVIHWITGERGRMFRQLRKLNFLQPYPSQANFLLCQVTRGAALTVRDALSHQGVRVRHIAAEPLLPNHLRISVGRPEDTDTLMHALQKVAQEL